MRLDNSFLEDSMSATFFFAHHFAPFILILRQITYYEKHYGKSICIHRIYNFLQNLHNEIYIQIFSCTWNTVL